MSTNIAVISAWGIDGGEAASVLSMKPETTERLTKPTNHGQRAAPTSDASRGAPIPQTPTALPFANPPRLHWRKKGNVSHIVICEARNKTIRFVLEMTIRPIPVSTA